MNSGRLRALVVTTVFVLLASSCSGDDGPGVDEARLVVDGSATVTDADGAVEIVTGSASVDFGDVVSVQDGTATVELAAGPTYELRAGVGDAGDSELVVGATPTLLAGDALVASGFPASIRYDTATVSAQGALKVAAGVPQAAAYAGRTRISGAGDLEELVGLRQVVLTPSARPEPLAYDGADPWDRRFLGEAIAFGERLDALARGYTNDLQPGPRPVSFYESILPALDDEREFNADLLSDDRPAGDTLVGAAIAIQGRSGTFRDRWNAVFAFRDQGAAWGLVALDQGVSSAPVLDTIELAIGESPLSDAPRTTTTPPERPGRPPSTTRPPGSTAPPPTTTSTPPPPPPEEDEDGLLTPALTPVEEILTEVLDALGLG